MKRIIAMAAALIIVATGLAQASSLGGDVETELFLKAKANVYARKWVEARTGLEAYLTRYPSGRFEEEARYWLARSLNQLSDGEEDASAIQIKETAVSVVDELIDRRPKGRWSGDAMALKAELAADLAAAGRMPYLQFLERLAGSKDRDESAMLLAATMILAEGNPVVGLVLIDKSLAAEKDPAVRKQLVSFVGAYCMQLGLPTLRRIAQKDPDESVRAEAARWIARQEMDALPVTLNYYCYTARLEQDQSLIPEGKLNVYDFPAVRSAKKVTKEIKKRFDGKLSKVKFAAGRMSGSSSRLPILEALEGRTTAPLRENNWRVTHEIAGFRVEVPEESIKKERLRVSGEASFFDTARDLEYLEKFTVDDIDGKLIAMRRGDEVAILVLQFESFEEYFGAQDETSYNTRFSDVFGAVVSSSRETWSVDELAGLATGRVVDCGRAKAEIPGADGTWILIGDIQILGAEKSFAGRGAVLYDPKGKIAAQGPEIVVPAENPSRFRIAEKK